MCLRFCPSALTASRAKGPLPLVLRSRLFRSRFLVLPFRALHTSHTLSFVCLFVYLFVRFRPRHCTRYMHTCSPSIRFLSLHPNVVFVSRFDSYIPIHSFCFALSTLRFY